MKIKWLVNTQAQISQPHITHDLWHMNTYDFQSHHY